MRVQAFGGHEWRSVDPPGELGRDWLAFAFWSALALSLTARLATGWALSLWFDEVYTGTIASQADVTALVRWCLSELTGPAFYAPMWLWAKVVGTGDAALRIPALLMSLAGPLWIAWRGYPERDVRLLWAIFSLLWLPMLPMATEARPYPQIFLLGSLQAIAFLRLSKSPGLRPAFIWSTVTALSVLTNYYALVISGFQGLALLATHRQRLLKLHAALLPLILAGAWMVFHLPFVLHFAAEHGAMFERLPPSAVLAVPYFVFGPGLHAFAIFALIAFTQSLWWTKGAKFTPEAQLVLAGVAAFMLVFAVGLFRATLTPRYLTPGVPALLFGLALWAIRVRSKKPAVVAVMLAIFFVTAGAPLVAGSSDERFRDRANLQFETASAWLMEQPMDRLYFVKPAPSPTPAHDAQIAGFFFARAGRPVDAITSDYKSAMTPRLADDRRAGVLFIGDTGSSGEVRHWLEARAWACRDFGQAAFAIMACRPRPQRSPRGPSGPSH